MSITRQIGPFLVWTDPPSVYIEHVETGETFNFSEVPLSRLRESCPFVDVDTWAELSAYELRQLIEDN